jgi:hypothetical protein
VKTLAGQHDAGVDQLTRIVSSRLKAIACKSSLIREW